MDGELLKYTQNRELSLNNLGMTAADKQDLVNLIQLPHGIILVTGDRKSVV